jgi:peptidoglycan/LPS O-acetylase OafA/YrhL
VPALDGLRAAAVIAVLLFHAGYLQGGFLGVDLFFALSGFLITSLLIRDATTGQSDLIAFWGRRFRRLLPAVFTMIFLVALWSLVFGSAADLDGVKNDGPWAVLYLANWHFIADSTGYWASFAQPAMFDHLWSLAIEEQFYVVWPVVVGGIWAWSKRPQGTLLILSVIGCVASLIAMVLLYGGGDPTRVYMGTDTRAASLLVGAVAATAPVQARVKRIAERVGARLDLLIVAIGSAVLWSWFAIDGASSASLYRGGLLVHSIACATLVVLAVHTVDGRTVRMLSWGPLTRIGLLSYGLYLWHWPLFVILSPDRTGLDGPLLATVRIAASFVAAYVSYRFVEDPLRHRARWMRGRLGVVVMGLSVAGLLAFLVALPQPTSEIARFDASTVTRTTSPATSPRATAAPPAAAPDDEPGVVETTAVATTVPEPRRMIDSAIWAGDSIAFELEPPVIAALEQAGVPVTPGSFYGVRLMGPDQNIRLVSQLAGRLESSSADTVLMVMSPWDSDVADEEYAGGLRELADMLPPTGQLIVITAPPLGNEDDNRELARLAAVATEVAAGSGGRIAFVDTAPIWPTPAVRDADGDGVPERKADLAHICPAGGAQFAAWLVDVLAERFDGVAPVDPAAWAGGPWVTDPRYDRPVGACAPIR